MPNNNQPPKQEIQKRVNQVESIYQEYLAELNKLQQKQNEVIRQFVKELEQRKMEEIKKILK